MALDPPTGPDQRGRWFSVSQAHDLLLSAQARNGLSLCGALNTQHGRRAVQTSEQPLRCVPRLPKFWPWPARLLMSC